MNAHVETLRKMLGQIGIDHGGVYLPCGSKREERTTTVDAALQAAIAALEAQGEAVAWRFTAGSKWMDMSDLNHFNEYGTVIGGPNPNWSVEYAYAVPPSSPAMRAVVEATRNAIRLAQEESFRTAMDMASWLLDHPEVKKLMGEE